LEPRLPDAPALEQPVVGRRRYQECHRRSGTQERLEKHVLLKGHQLRKPLREGYGEEKREERRHLAERRQEKESKATFDS
jgi:hypothetical protein